TNYFVSRRLPVRQKMILGKFFFDTRQALYMMPAVAIFFSGLCEGENSYLKKKSGPLRVWNTRKQFTSFFGWESACFGIFLHRLRSFFLPRLPFAQLPCCSQAPCPARCSRRLPKAAAEPSIRMR